MSRKVDLAPVLQLAAAELGAKAAVTERNTSFPATMLLLREGKIMWHQVLIVLLLSVSNVLIHALGSYVIFRWIVLVFSKHPAPNTLQAWTLMVRMVLGLLVLHALEVAVWAYLYVARHCFPDTETAYYYSLTCYTTLGFGDVVLPPPWRLLGGCEAMVGILMFGWSTAVLVGLLHHILDIRVKSYASHAAR